MIGSVVVDAVDDLYVMREARKANIMFRGAGRAPNGHGRVYLSSRAHRLQEFLEKMGYEDYIDDIKVK